jgi:hypothetical protein
MAVESSEVAQIGRLAEAGVRMVDRLRRQSFLPEQRKALNIRFGIAEAFWTVRQIASGARKRMDGCPLLQ